MAVRPPFPNCRTTATAPRLHLEPPHATRLGSNKLPRQQHPTSGTETAKCRQSNALRVSELVNIRWQQIHLDTATIDVRRAKNGTPGIHGLQGDELRLLRALRREHPHADFVFLSERKAPLSVDGAQKLIERLGVAAELPFPIHAHMLRHAAGYALAGRGIDTRTLQAFMGHRSIANTVVYTAVADKRIRNIWGK
jgi:integrase